MQEQVKFELGDLLGIGMTFVVLGVALAYGLEVTGDVKDDIGTDDCAARSDSYTAYNTSSGNCYNASGEVSVGTAQFNATKDAITGVAKIPNKLPTIATVVVAAVILGVLVRYLYMRFRG